MPAISLREIIEEAYQANPSIIDCAACDIQAVRHRDPAVELCIHSITLFKRFPRNSKLSNYPLFMESKS